VETRTITKMGRSVSVLGLGGMPMSLADRPPRTRAIATIHAALDAGIDFIDTADVYCIDDDDIGHNEALIREAVETHSLGSQALIATKGGLRRPSGDWTVDARPERLQEACEHSLKVLGVECIELYQLHAPDERVPFADSVGALARLQEVGKVQHIGLSNVNVDEIRSAMDVCEIVSVQNRCHAGWRSSFENGVVDFCAEHDILFLAHSPVGGYRSHVSLTAEPVVREIAESSGASAYRVVLAWLLQRSPAILPIPGASRPHSITDSASASTLTLTPQQMAQIDAAEL